MTSIAIKFSQKTTAVLVALAIALCGLLAFASTAQAATPYKYNPSKALSYAKSHWNNKKEADGNKPDCVRFVRSCVEKGGVVRDKSKTSGYHPGEYVTYLTKKGYVTKYKLTPKPWSVNSSYQVYSPVTNAGKVGLGDVLAYKCRKCGQFFHLAIVSGLTGDRKANGFSGEKTVTLYAHNVAQNNKTCLKFRCSKCHANANKTDIYSLHFKSKANGFNKQGIPTPVGMGIAAANGAMTVQWSQLSGVNGYEVCYSTTNSFVPSTSVKVAGASKSSTKISNMTSGATYYVKVRSYAKKSGKTKYSDWSVAQSVVVK